jgi:ATP-dependent Lhr-like helicase
VLYLERGGRTVLCFTDDSEVLRAAGSDLAATARARRLDTLTVEKVNGEGVYGTELALALQEAGFVATPRGYTLRKVI